MRLPRAPHPRVTCARNIKKVIRLEIAQDSWCSKPPLGTKQDLATRELARKVDRKLLSSYLSWQATLSPWGFFQNVFGNETEVLREGKTRICISQTTLLLASFCHRHLSCPPDSPTPKKTSMASTREANFLYTQRHSYPAEQGIICPTARSTSYQVPLPLIMHQTD